MPDKALKNEIHHYSEWRSQLSDVIQELSVFLQGNELVDLDTAQQLQAVLASLADDNLSIAFVAEFSRGKSELINTIFFGDYKQRILPSGSGRTTMCPTELLYDSNQPSSIRLLPIESRAEPTALYELKKEPKLWTETVFDADDADSLSDALKGMTDSKLVSKAYAEKLGFNLMTNSTSGIGLPLNEYDEVEIPIWRHAIINLPHPLLEQGLVILDTPGLNAIGAEPELTINQLASAHTVVFILSHDTGVTATDLALWQEHLGGKPNASSNTSEENNSPALRSRPLRKLVALNKIDSLWDGIRSDKEIDREIDRQVWQTAVTLHLEPENIFPVSAQKGLLGRFNGDQALVERSRITELESAIAERLVPEKRQIVVSKVQMAIEGIIDTSSAVLSSRLNDIATQSSELSLSNSKNFDVIEHIMSKAHNEKASLKYDLELYEELSKTYQKEAVCLLRLLSEERLEKLIVATKHNMARCATSITLQKIISKYFAKLNGYLDQAISQANDMTIISESFALEFEKGFGISDLRVRRLRLDGFKMEISRLEQEYSHLRETKTLFFREQMTITNRFYESVCGASRKVFNRALRDANNWNKNLLVPLRTHMRNRHSRLRRRLDSVKRIYNASHDVTKQLEDLETEQSILQAQQVEFYHMQAQLAELLAHSNALTKESNKVKPSTAEILYWEHQANF